MLEGVDEDVRGAHVVQEAAGHPGLAAAEGAPDGLHEVAVELVFEVEVGVPGELHRVGPPHLPLREEGVQVQPDHVVQVHDRGLRRLLEDDEPAQGRAGELHQRVVGAPRVDGLDVPLPELHHEVDPAVPQEGAAAVLGGEEDRLQVRGHLPGEVVPHPGHLVRGHPGVAHEVDARAPELAHEPSQELSVAVLLLHHDPVDVVEEAVRVHPQLALFVGLQPEEGPEGGHAHPEVLVQVGREDAAEEEALQQRDRRVLGLLEHPVGEREPGDLPVHQRLVRLRRHACLPVRGLGSPHGTAPGLRKESPP